ncbi:MAG: alpha/beta fold hydrolase [Burkholderiales bacterium]|nr:alpha/beta fold hydrolase [Burkholderiales bacterium]
MKRHSALARMQQASMAVFGLAALAWLWWRWPASPAAAIVGALAIAFSFAFVLALQFVIVHFVSRGDPAPRPTPGELLRAWWNECLLFAQIFYWRQPFRWRALPDRLDAGGAGRRGVVFIHGFVCNRGFWTPWLERLAANGTPYAAVNLEPVFAPIDAYAPIIEQAVAKMEAATGLAPVLVCHSMGGLAARAWLRASGDASRVHRVVTIGSPHQGAWIARISHTPNGKQMRLDGGWLQQLASDEAARPQPPFTCWYSNCDNIVFPATTATLPHADNRHVRGQAHVQLGFHPEVIEGSLAAM